MKMKMVRPKPNMIIVRGLRGKEIVGEDFHQAERRAYTELAPQRTERGNGYYTLVLLVPGREPHVSEAVFYRGCNALAITPEASQIIGG